MASWLLVYIMYTLFFLIQLLLPIKKRDFFVTLGEVEDIGLLVFHKGSFQWVDCFA